MTYKSVVVICLIGALPACGGHSEVTASSTAAYSNRSHHRRQPVVQTNLVSDQPGVAAVQDPQLVNAWGLAFNPAGPAWVSDNATGLTTVYDATGALKLTVTIPPPASAAPPSAPTGQVFNGASTDFGGDKFIFVTEDGTVSGWQPKTGAVLHFDNSSTGAVYKGVALGTSSSGATLLYATNFNAGRVDVFDNTYAPTTSAGGFVDTYLPDGFAPFNVFVSGAQVFVSYALQDDKKHDDVPGEGYGLIDLFDTDGNFVQRLVSGDRLNAPWGLAIAPATFGNLGGALLVGNFGDGHIDAYSLDTDYYGNISGASRGFLADDSGEAIAIDGLWAIAFGPDAGGSNSNQLYFTAGPAGETHGLFGHLDVP